MSTVPSPAITSDPVPPPVVIRPFERDLPPVVAVGMAALAIAVVAGVLIVSQIGTDSSLDLPAVLVGIAVFFEVVAAGVLATISPFAWSRFWQVFGWALLAYVLQAGIIAWSLVRNDVPTGPLIIVSVALVVFATIVPVMIAFTVARYQAIDD